LECRDSLRDQSYPTADFKVYIIDNASTPETESYLRSEYPEAVVLTRPDGNYSAANNLGLRHAFGEGYDYGVVANMDTKFDEKWLEGLVAAADNNKDAGAVQSKILLYPASPAEAARPRINTVGNAYQFLGFGFTRGYGEEDRLIEGTPEIKGYGSGCSLLIKKEAYEAVGGYDEDYYMYHDDIELGLKLRLAGYKILLAPASVVYHKYEFHRSVQMFYYMERNRYLTLIIFYPLWLLILLLPPLFLMELGLLGLSLKNKQFKTRLKIYAYFLNPKNWIRLIRRRRSFDHWRFGEIARGFAAKIEFSEIDNPLLRYFVNPLLVIYWRLICLLF
jgi:GT2 family glycosyltransferase